MAEEIPARDWQTIVERIYAGQCVPFLGAGVNVSTDGYVGLPLGAQVALRLAEDLVATSVDTFAELAEVRVVHEAVNQYPDLLRMELQDLARVALHLERAVDSPYLMEILRRVLRDEDCKPSRLLATLARLPVRLIVTTNYDRLMERALAEAGREHQIVVQPAAGFDPVERARLDEMLADCKANGTLILYKIHGSFPAGNGQQAQDRIIITEEDYIEFLTVAGDEQIGVPPAIKAEIATGTLLFLGYSLEDWDFRTIFKGTVEKLDRHRIFKSFAVQRHTSPFWRRFWEVEKHVVIYDMDLHAFAAALEERCESYSAGLASS